MPVKGTLHQAAVLIVCASFCLSFLTGQARASSAAVSAQSAVLMDQSTGRLLYEKNGYEKLPIASITKIMTAILAIESGKMDQYVTVSSAAAKAEGSSIYTVPGEKIRMKDLVYGLMLRSGNDASLAIAEAVGGSVAGFIFMMNEKAALLGMTDTHFTNPNGLENPDHYSTAYDMATLMRYAMTQPVFRKITGTELYHAAATNKEDARSWKNKNKMLRLYKYTTGGKTGYTKAAGRTLVSTASRNNMDLIAVTLNDGDDWRDHESLFDWGFSEFQMTKVVKKGWIKAETASFYQNRLFTNKALSVPLSIDERNTFRKRLILVRPPAHVKGWVPPSPAGRMVIELEHRVIASVPVYYKKTEEKKRKFWTIFTGFVEAAVTGKERPLL